ncbi:MAG: hypothetical protein AWU58_1688 [Methanohalophilus sp. T328-1]|uniref:DUF2150 family protein n=1 Tax=Methanohalophilus sp. DAL1 TaxID=1864608 RepID=UPI0007970985|nr:DUF2150 family protein [Methanohalophilus sp. DAL1]KXS41552.1 MAG: hypothetical protein AWU58_1688 [Methanohalophilus sp. T328-1]OBZ35050.1 MAG: hypothetical protein A9957_08715 [Methanohalophilus sp. DAL1]
MPETNNKQIFHEFYTEKRWNNWLQKVEESNFKLEESGEAPEKDSAIFVNMQDDVILACLKVIATGQRGDYSVEETLDILSSIEEIVMKKVDPISEDADMMIESLQNSLLATFVSFECYLNGNFDGDSNISDLINGAIEAEQDEDFEAALGYVARIGALVLDGQELPGKQMEDMPYGIVAEWMDGIDSIEAAMVGTDSYKEDDGDYEVV